MNNYRKIEVSGEDIIIKEVENFELKDIFDCGQAFRWNKTESGSYIGVAFGKVIEVEKNGDTVIIHNSSLQDFNNIWVK